MRANDFLTEREVNTTNKQGVQTTVNKAANRVTTRDAGSTTVKDRSGNMRSMTTPRIGGTQFKQTFRPDATPGYQQANLKSGPLTLDIKGSPETGFTKSAAYSAGGLNAKQTQRYSGQTQSDLSYNMGKDTKLSAKSTVSKPGAKPVVKMNMTNDINEAFEYAIEDDGDMDREMNAEEEQFVDMVVDYYYSDGDDRSSDYNYEKMERAYDIAGGDPSNSTKRSNFLHDEIVNKLGLMEENETELSFEDDDQFFEDFGYLGYSIDENDMFEAEYQGRKVKLNKPMQGDVKKFKVYVKNKKGNVIKVNFGHGGSSVKGKAMRIRKSNPKARKSFRARHNCDNPGPKTKARYWSCRKW